MFEQLTRQFVDEKIDRRTFIKRLTQAGVTLAGATAMAESLSVEKTLPESDLSGTAPKQGRVVKNLTGGEVMLEFMRDWDIPYLFGLAGSEEVGLLDALVDRPEIPFVTCLHENAAVAMADGFSRSTGRTSLVSLHSVAGTAYGLGQMVGSYRDRVPIVICAGRQAVDYRGQDGFLEAANLHTLPENYVSWTWDVMHESTTAEVLRRAFMFAEAPPGGPAFVTFSNDLWEKQVEQAEILPRSRSLANNDIPAPGRHVVRIVDNLLAAKRPVLFLGNETHRFDCSDEVAEIASLTGSLVMLSSKIPITFDPRHPYFAGQFHRDDPSLSEQIDCFWSLGGHMFKHAKKPERPLIKREAVIMHTSLASEDVGRNYPIDTAAIANIQSTAAAVLAELKTRKLDTKENTARKNWAKIYVSGMRAEYEVKAKQEWNNKPIATSRLMIELDKHIDEGAYIVSEVVTSDDHVRKYLRFDHNKPKAERRKNFDTTSGVLGWAVSAAIGVKIGNPDKEVWCLTGDGCFNFGVQALWTAARYEVPIAVVIFNNGEYQANRINQNRPGGRRMMATGKYIGVNLGHPDIDYVHQAAAYGIKGERVTEPGKIAAALKRAQKSIKAGKPYVVDVRIAKRFYGKESEYYDFFSVAEMQRKQT